MAPQVPEEVKQARLDRLMERPAADLAARRTRPRSAAGAARSSIEGYGDGVSIGRSYRDAPEIDGLVFVPGELPVGELVPVRIDGAMAYDLTATPLVNAPQTILLDAVDGRA